MVAQGNGVETPFRPSQGGWYAVMVGALDSTVCEVATEQDPRITFDPADDSISCAHCWASIYGGLHKFPSA
ncbi:MAG: hypothetical protein NVSMB48_04410 [Marmoricola sp.]